MNTNSTDKWLSTHIYYNQPWEHFLHASLYPFVDSALKMGIIQQFFFVRYWERGPHIRLTIKGEQSSLDSILKPHLEEHFASYIERNPSSRIDPNYPSNFPDHYKWHPNNTIRYVSYLPELSRFGGLVGQAICEAQFHHSSVAVLDVLKRNKLDWTYEDAMSSAIQLHTTFAHAVGLSIAEAIEFFEFFYNNHLRKPSQRFQTYEHRPAFEEDVAETEQTFERALSFQSKIMQQHLQKLWLALESPYQQVPQNLQRWHFNNQVVGKKLAQASITNQLRTRTRDFQFSFLPKEEKQQLIWSLYADFVHLTNNRLGLMHRDESFIAYIIMKSLAAIQEGGREQLGLRLRD